MKWLWAFLALALAWPSRARGLKAPRAPDVSAVLSKQLQVENQALKKQNQHLEAMMQMARTEVQRMDVAALQKARNQRQRNSGDAEVLMQEIQDLKKKLQTAESDKADLVQTLQRMLKKNSTQMFQKQAERAEQMKMALEMKCGRDRAALEAEVKQANGKCDETKEVAQTLQDENEDMKRKLHVLTGDLGKAVQSNNNLHSDKANLVATMQALMRGNSRCKDLEQREAKELLGEKAAIAKLSKKAAPKPAVEEKSKKVSKALLGYHKHAGSGAAKMARALKRQEAHMRDIDKYIDSYDDSASEVSANDERTEQQVQTKLSAVQRQEDLFAKGKVGSHLSDWLGFKAAQARAKVAAQVIAQAAERAAAEQAAKKQKATPEAEAEALVNEAKAQLADMESADTDSPAL